jgi:23S rRNA (cytosine1962-C5)-methyltransferase
MVSIRLKPGREKSLIRRHPWVFAGAIQEIIGSPDKGETVRVLSASGDFLAWGAYSPLSQIRVRVWSSDPDESIDDVFFNKRLEEAYVLRRAIFTTGASDAIRLVHGESDGLPGLVVDRYGEILVVQFLSCGVERWRETLVDLLTQFSGTRQIYERSDADVRQLEGLPTQVGILRGEEPPKLQAITENGVKFSVDLRSGHKTGFYLDQRGNRRRVRRYAAGRDVLDCFSYTGGFLLNSLVGGARSVLAIDAAPDALTLGQQNLSLNPRLNGEVNWLEGDVFHLLRSFRDERRSFDMIILDPPKFAPTTSQVERAARGYKDINLLAFKLLRPEGILFTFSCSGGVSADLFQKIVASAAVDAKVDAQILEHLHQDIDHPIALNFPEGEYLKGLVVRKLK